VRITERFGAAVRIHRKHAGLSQEQLALKADLDRTYVSGVERGVRNPSLTVIHRLAQALKVREDELFRTVYEETA
jgi:transcriptional regulator with XRE-family HTH domain